MDESNISTSKMTIFTRNIQLWCWWLLFVFVQNVRSNPTQVSAQFMSYCNQTLNTSSSPLSIIFTPPLSSSSSSSSCCNITFNKSPLSDSSEQILLNIINLSTINPPPLRVFNTKMQPIQLMNYFSLLLNRNFTKTDPQPPSLIFSLCQFDINPFEILISNISKGVCKSHQVHCSTTGQWCIDENLSCDGFHSCPDGSDENTCTKSTAIPRSFPARTIRGGLVTTIIVFGLLLIIGSVVLALGFVYLQRKRQRRRQFTYSLESTSDDWEPSGAGYHLFDNWTNNRRSVINNNNDDNIASDSNEHMPITTTVMNR